MGRLYSSVGPTLVTIDPTTGMDTDVGLPHAKAPGGSYGGLEIAVPESTTVVVNDAPLTAGTVSASGGVEGVTPTTLSATFTDANLNAPASDFSGTINWGDGNPVTNFDSSDVTANGNGSFTINASYQYAEESGATPYNITVTINDVGTSTTSDTGTTTVADAPLTAGTVSASGGVEGVTPATLSATFTDANLNAPPSDFSGTINWGDGNPVTNFDSSDVTANGNGSFSLNASYQYAEESGATPYNITVTINDVGGSSTSDASTTTVADAALTGNLSSLSTPPGLNPGDHFRVLYVTGYVSDATSTDVTTYNNTVNSQALGATYDGTTVTWFAVASTSSVSAITNVGVDNVAVYLPNGVELATSDSTSPGGLWSGAALLTTTQVGISGNYQNAFVWTGTSPNGQAVPGYALGTNQNYDPIIGITTNQAGSWVDIGATGNGQGYDALQALYGISQELTVPTPVTATGGVEGVTAATLSNATFTDANLGAPSTGFTVTAANWGDGSASTAGLTVSGSNGNYTVNGSHLYTDEGTYNFSFTVTDVGGSTTTISGSTTVADAPLTAGTVSASGGVEGVTPTTLSATFTDANLNAPTSDFSGTINWGDGNAATQFTSADVTANGDGSFIINASYQYAEESGATPYNITVTINDVGTSTTTDTGTTTVADAPLTAGTVSASGGVEGVTPTTLSATFSDANVNAPASDFSGTINWGDGNPATSITSADVTANGDGSFTINASYQYAEESGATPYSITVTINDVGGSSTSNIGSTTVADAPLTAGTLSATGGVEFTTPTSLTATFSDANVNAPASDFSGTINWGDGNPATNFDSSDVTANGDGSFTINASYQYAEESGATPYTIAVTINDVGTSTTSDTGTTTVADAPLMAALVPSTPNAADLIHEWNFATGTANDLVGTANGTLNGGATISGGELQLNGTTAYMATDAGSSLSASGCQDADIVGQPRQPHAVKRQCPDGGEYNRSRHLRRHRLRRASARPVDGRQRQFHPFGRQQRRRRRNGDQPGSGHDGHRLRLRQQHHPVSRWHLVRGTVRSGLAGDVPNRHDQLPDRRSSRRPHRPERQLPGGRSGRGPGLGHALDRVADRRPLRSGTRAHVSNRHRRDRGDKSNQPDRRLFRRQPECAHQ